MNVKIFILIVGLMAGGLIGYLTRPQASEIKLGPLSVEMQDTSAAALSGGDLTSGQMQHVAIFAVLGAIVGLGIGFVVDRQKA
ncbi:hypothetical protein [Methylobacterium marchantiae]|uniref:Cobalt transporter n=1 Tax=Methylobacterium marchantiae TaxID=600331 RepID=A0ABW3X796_9HYPH